MSARRAHDARLIDSLILQLNRDSKFCFHVVQVLQDKPAYTDVFVYETKHHFTQALRLLKNANGSLRQATCLNFNPTVRFEQPSIAQVIGDIAAAVVTPELVAARALSPGEIRLEPIPRERTFELEPARAVVRRYEPARQIFDQNTSLYGKLFNKHF